MLTFKPICVWIAPAAITRSLLSKHATEVLLRCRKQVRSCVILPDQPGFVEPFLRSAGGHSHIGLFKLLPLNHVATSRDFWLVLPEDNPKITDMRTVDMRPNLAETPTEVRRSTAHDSRAPKRKREGQDTNPSMRTRHDSHNCTFRHRFAGVLILCAIFSRVYVHVGM